MDKETFEHIKALVINTRGSLYIRVWEREDLEIRYLYTGKEQILPFKSTVSVETNSDLLISAPKETNFQLQVVKGNCYFLGRFGNATIENIGGNLEIESIESGLIEKVGGNLKIGSLEGPVTVERVGGNFYLLENRGNLLCEKVGGNLFSYGFSGGMECVAGGNIVLSNANFRGSLTSLRAGGDIKVAYSGTPNFHLEAKSGGGFQIELGKDQFKGIYRSMNHTFGSRDTEVIMKAGGVIKINAKDQENRPDVHFKPSDDASWEDLDQKITERGRKYQEDFDLGSIIGGIRGININNHLDSLDSLDNLDDLDDLDDLDRLSHLDETITERIHANTDRIEARINRAMEKLNRKFKHDMGSFTDLGSDVSHQPVNANPPKPARQPVSDEERLMVLKMLQEKKISAEEADRLLTILEQS